MEPGPREGEEGKGSSEGGRYRRCGQGPAEREGGGDGNPETRSG